MRAQGWRYRQGYYFGRPAAKPISDKTTDGDLIARGKKVRHGPSRNEDRPLAAEFDLPASGRAGRGRRPDDGQIDDRSPIRLRITANLSGGIQFEAF